MQRTDGKLSSARLKSASPKSCQRVCVTIGVCSEAISTLNMCGKGLHFLT